MFHDAVFKILRGHLIRNATEKGLIGHEKIRLTEKLADCSSAAVIVHRRIPLVAPKMFGTIAPIFSKDISVWVNGFYFRADFGPKFGIKLDFVIAKENIRNVKTPAVDVIGRFEPFFEHGILRLIDFLAERFGGIIKGWHGFNAEPAFIAVVFAEEIIASFFRIGVVICADRFFKPFTVFVEPFVVGSGVVDGNIEHQFHSIFMKFGAQFFKGRVAAEMGVDMEIIYAIELMNRGGTEDWVKIKRGYSKFFKVWNFLGYAFKVATVEIETMAVLIIERNIFPVFSFYGFIAVLSIFTGFDVVFRVSVAKTFRENLIKDGIFDPFRFLIIRNEHEVTGMVGNIGGYSVLGVVINGVFGNNIELILKIFFGNFDFCFVIGQTVLGFEHGHFVKIIDSVWKSKKEHVLNGRMLGKTEPYFNCFAKFRQRVIDKSFCSVAVYALKPVFQEIRPPFKVLL